MEALQEGMPNCTCMQTPLVDTHNFVHTFKLAHKTLHMPVSCMPRWEARCSAAPNNDRSQGCWVYAASNSLSQEYRAVLFNWQGYGLRFGKVEL